MSAKSSARVFAASALLVVAFQLALVLGAPWGHLTMGGRFEGVLPLPMRAVAAFSALLLLSFAWVVRANAAHSNPSRRIRVALWVVVIYSVVGVVANAMTPSAAERRLWLPVVIVMFATSGHVLWSRRGASGQQ